MTALLNFFDDMPVTLYVAPNHPLIITRRGAQALGFDTAWDLLGFLQTHRLCVHAPDGEEGVNLLNVALAAQWQFISEGGFIIRLATGDLCLSQEQWRHA
jgi:hypothetical protein